MIKMKITRALILRIKNNDISETYSAQCADSCLKYGLNVEFIDCVYDMTCEDAYESLGVTMNPAYTNTDELCCCHCSHLLAWKRIVEVNEPCLILEHDAVVKGNVSLIDIPDNAIITFGFRIQNLNDYNPVSPIKSLVEIKRSIGGHAYTMTPSTAADVLNEAEMKGVSMGLDRFLMIDRGCKYPLYVAEPPQVVCWSRESLMTGRPQTAFNYEESMTPGWRAGFSGEYKFL